MDSILRGAITYLFVWLIFRLAGKRTLAQISTFDAVLLLIISEATQGALLDGNNSMTNSFLIILHCLGSMYFFRRLSFAFRPWRKLLTALPASSWIAAALMRKPLGTSA